MDTRHLIIELIPPAEREGRESENLLFSHQNLSLCLEDEKIQVPDIQGLFETDEFFPREQTWKFNRDQTEFFSPGPSVFFSCSVLYLSDFMRVSRTSSEITLMSLMSSL